MSMFENPDFRRQRSTCLISVYDHKQKYALKVISFGMNSNKNFDRNPLKIILNRFLL